VIRPGSALVQRFPSLELNAGDHNGRLIATEEFDASTCRYLRSFLEIFSGRP
jgi:hypothetical protein